MGFEVVYHYHPKDGTGNWVMNLNEELKVEVGGPFEEVEKDKLVGAIMSQMARRDILIFDVDIWELKKTKISFKEAKGGIILGTRKYSFDGVNLVFQEIESPKPNLLPAVQAPAQVIPPNNRIMPPALIPTNARPVKFVVLDPDEPNLFNIKKSGLAFTPDRRYPVFSEMPHPKKLGVLIYTMHDDNKREVSVTDEYFLNADQRLQRGFNSTVDRESNSLDYGTTTDTTMPDIRGR